MARSLPQVVLLVDGYNIIGNWASLKKTRDRMGLEAARWELTQALTDYSAFQGFSSQLIFDAQYRDSPGQCEVITQNLTIYYTELGQTADTYIEKVCALARQVSQRRIIVATSDRAQWLTATGYGAEWMSAQQLAHELRLTANLVRQRQKTSRKSPHNYLANSLDPAAKQRLERLRMGSG